MVTFQSYLKSVENPASMQAERINRLFNYFNVAAAAMLLLVTFFSGIWFKHREGDVGEPPQKAGNRKLEALMIGGPSLLLLRFFYQTVTTMNAVAVPVYSAEQPEVIITGHQWWLEADYPAAHVITANEVHLPAGKEILLEMRSADVIHDWWVPELGNKTDLVPGRKNYLRLYIPKPGTYTGACSEFCGAQHAWMRIHVTAENEHDYSGWLAANRKDAAPPKDSLAMKGAAIFQAGTCAGCHRIQGTAAVAAIGPDLTHLAGRKDLLTGVIRNNDAGLYGWIDHPRKIKPGAHMPRFNYSRDTIEAIVHYLDQLK